MSADPASPPLPTDQPAAAADRQVIRRATVELQSPDVRATFVKVGLLVSEARGEFVQTSTITGEGPTARAELVLRVASDRLSEVMNHLRSLGEVASENTTGEDVTDQVVDVEARLRNERRVESELLSLLETRKDAPLKEILELRQQIGVVRNEIERMQAQRERLGRLVALATVAVIVRHSEVEPVVTRSEFSQRLERAWAAGLGALTDSLAFLIRAAVGGLLWWALLGVGVTTVLAMRRRDRRRRTDEPAPFLG